uniref:Uncharacterized protein n=1 Tax=Timema tahoe TaxID=61484 RepID=A0A7R9P183_9NEOP|nr:unnamed protein product [Timema tahoe]
MYLLYRAQIILMKTILALFSSTNHTGNNAKVSTKLSNITEDQDVCTRKATPVKPLAITSIFNTLFPLDEVEAKRVIVGMNVNNNFTPYVQLEKCGRNWAVFNRTEWQELGSYKSVITKFFSNTQPPQKISLTNHEISLRCMCGDRMVFISGKQDAGLKRAAYLAPSWVRLCDVWDLIDVAVDRQDMWLTPVARYCNDLIDICDTLTESVNVIDLEQPTVEMHIKNLDFINATYYKRQLSPSWRQDCDDVTWKPRCLIDGGGEGYDTKIDSGACEREPFPMLALYAKRSLGEVRDVPLVAMPASWNVLQTSRLAEHPIKHRTLLATEGDASFIYVSRQNMIRHFELRMHQAPNNMWILGHEWKGGRDAK